MSRATSRVLILVLVLLLALAGLFFLLRPSPTPETATAPGSTTEGSQEKTFDLAIEGGDSMTPDQITVAEGDRVNLRITSNEPLEFHLHGYDLMKDVEPGEPADLSFDATITGRFDIENEQAQKELGTLLVQPG